MDYFYVEGHADFLWCTHTVAIGIRIEFHFGIVTTL